MYALYYLSDQCLELWGIARGCKYDLFSQSKLTISTYVPPRMQFMYIGEQQLQEKGNDANLQETENINQIFVCVHCFIIIRISRTPHRLWLYTGSVAPLNFLKKNTKTDDTYFQN